MPSAPTAIITENNVPFVIPRFGALGSKELELIVRLRAGLSVFVGGAENEKLDEIAARDCNSRRNRAFELLIASCALLGATKCLRMR